MDIKISAFSVALVLLSLLGVALGSPASSALVKKAETLEDILWANCWLEMIHSKKEYEDLDFSIFGTFGAKIPANEVLTDENVQKLMSVIYQQISPELFYCIREKVFISPISGDDNSLSEKYIKVLKSLVSKMPAKMRRYLAVVSEGPSQEVAQSPRSATFLSGVGQAPISVPSPSPVGQAPISAPSPSAAGQVPRSATSPSAAGQEPRSVSSPSAAGNVVIPSSSSNLESNKDGGNHKTTVIAVVVTAAVTFIFALLFLYVAVNFVGCVRAMTTRMIGPFSV